MTLEVKPADIEVPLAVSIPKLARLTGVSEGTLYLRANEGALPGCRRIGKRWVIHLETFNDFLKTGMGELLLLPGGSEGEAEACFNHALEVSRSQSAKSLELRAAMSLARLWQQKGKTSEGKELLAGIYGWFTEGFDTPDLIDAKALLEELS